MAVGFVQQWLSSKYRRHMKEKARQGCEMIQESNLGLRPQRLQAIWATLFEESITEVVTYTRDPLQIGFVWQLAQERFWFRLLVSIR